MWELVVIALVITLEPLPLIAFILVLSTERGVTNGLAYIAGWVSCLVAIIWATLAVTDGHPPRPHTAPGRGVSGAVVAIGVLLLGVALRQWRIVRSGPRPAKPPPKWMARVGTMGPGASAGLGVALQPWPFVAAGAATVAQADATTAGSIVAMVAFCVLATASLAVMEAYTAFAHDAAMARLGALREWVTRHRDAGLFVIALLGGISLVFKGVYQLAH